MHIPSPVLCLLGPTASGKTAAALMLAQHFPVEIVSLDSALVYRDMNIGTAKPTLAQRNQVPHHLIDILDPSQSYSAATFANDAHTLIADIRHRGNYPLIVGGTLLYYKALAEGLSDLPPANEALRAELDAQGVAHGWPHMHARLALLDPITAARLAPKDAQRIQRALEVVLLTGRPMSELFGVKKNSPPVPLYPITLEPNDRAQLHARIAVRFDEMCAQGLFDEVAQLRARGDLTLNHPSMRSVGYRQIWQYLDGTCNRLVVREQVLAATRQLAKRQLTWLRSMSERQMIVCDQENYLNDVLAAARYFWRGLSH
ncbi:MAG: tRNA (adenosine(37)-N6)-dimethylallyltransferase MiaA [Ottowia sp.]|nr:tRNA (adenosine(37)-N6)-dimethylallyltransferase MiaA [Ottowia sp.]